MTEVNLRRPTRLSQYLQHEHAVTFATNLIANNFYKEIRSICITGFSGSGKTLLASLIARTTLCENRQEGETEACGECDVCKGLDTSNIEHYTISNSTEAREHIKRLEDVACSYPVVSSPRPDNNYRFIIIDEFELASAELAARLLDPIEFSPATTVWIIISMDPKKLEKRDPIIKEAIDSRCVSINLSRFSPETVAANLMDSYPELNKEAALSIGKLSGGNMRKAWNELVFFRGITSVDSITESLVFDIRFGGATKEARYEMWNQLSQGNLKEVSTLFNWWLEQADVNSLVNLLEEDLIDFMYQGIKGADIILSGLSRWHSNPTYSPLVNILPFSDILEFGKEEKVHVRTPLVWSGEAPQVNVKDLLTPKVLRFFHLSGNEIMSYV